MENDFWKKQEQETEEQLGETQAPAVSDGDENEQQPEPLQEEAITNEEEQLEQEQDSEVVAEEEQSEPEQQIEEEEPQERMFTQSQVNQMVGKARKEGRESAMKDLLSRYGVDTEDEMNEVFGRGQAYDYLNDEYETQSKTYQDVASENALLKSRISEDRWDDVKLILNGKGLEVNAENIEMFLPTHPEWRGAGGEELLQFQPQQPQSQSLEGETESVKEGVESMVQPKQPQQPQYQYKQKQPATLRKLGHESQSEPESESEDEKAKKLFGL